MIFHIVKYRYIVAIPVFVFIIVVCNYSGRYLKYTHDRSEEVVNMVPSKLDQLVLLPPMPKNTFYPHIKYSQAHQDEVVYEIIKKQNGFFVEMGAFNGIKFSNTLWLERMHNWTGLLIEANPTLCQEIDKVKRNAWRLCACISTKKQATFIKGQALSGVKDELDIDLLKFLRREAEITVPCFTLDAVLKEINVDKIDYFSLDVEGAELFILNTIKKQLLERKLFVGIWTIEYRVYDGKKAQYDKSLENLKNIRLFFKTLPYLEHSQLDQVPRSTYLPDGFALDVVFVHKSIWCTNNNTVRNETDCSKPHD